MSFSGLKTRLKQTLREDRAFSDITTNQISSQLKKVMRADILAKKEGVYCGDFLLGPLFKILDPRIQIKHLKKDGAQVRKGQILAQLKGQSKAILGGERSFLNLASHLSGISTLTAKFVKAVRGYPSKIFDTRKTMPLWRDIEKYAVRCGGGWNHRMSLGDAILVKDTHLKYIRTKADKDPHLFYNRKSLQTGRKQKLAFVEMEAESYADVWEGIKAEADIIMLDNMKENEIKGAITFIQSARLARGTDCPLVEISGGVHLNNVRKWAKLGVDRISVGALTHSAPSLDISLEVY